MQVSDEIAPNYSKRIKNKMALSDMKTKIARDEYPTLAAFGADIELVINNCKSYNAKGSSIVQVPI